MNNTPKTFNPGDRVRVADPRVGSINGMVGDILDRNPDRPGHVVVNLEGGPWPVEFEPSQLVPAGDPVPAPSAPALSPTEYETVERFGLGGPTLLDADGAADYFGDTGISEAAAVDALGNILLLTTNEDGDAWYQGFPEYEDEEHSAVDANNGYASNLPERRWPLTIVHTRD